jgi:hypothetical protein
VVTKIPHDRLTRAGKGITFGRTQKWEGRVADKLNKNHLTRNLVHRLERLGYQVTLTLQEKAA